MFAGSPTQKVGYEVLSELPKERHERPMLSLNKTKSVDELREWLGGQKGLLSWKMDGLTVVLTYEDGVLAKAVTSRKRRDRRGDHAECPDVYQYSDLDPV